MSNRRHGLEEPGERQQRQLAASGLRESAISVSCCTIARSEHSLPTCILPVSKFAGRIPLDHGPGSQSMPLTNRGDMGTTSDVGRFAATSLARVLNLR